MFVRILLAISAAALVGCASNQPGPAPMEENAVVHTATPEDLAATKDKHAIAADSAILYVNGLGCPLCASNVDKQLLRLSGVEAAEVDLSTGTVAVTLAGTKRPSPYRISEAVLDAGFTLVKIETR